MQRRTAAGLAWASFAVSGATIVASSVVAVLDGGWVGGSVGLAVLSIAAFPLMGALIASRRPENAIGWIFCGIGVLWGLAALTAEYSTYALLRRDPLIGGGIAAWMQRWIWAPGVTLPMTFLLLLYPDGHLPSKRWRPVAWLAGLAIVLQTVPVALASWSLPGRFLLRVDEDVPPGAPASFETAFAVQVIAILLVFVIGIASAGSLVVRYRRARDEQRAQIRWFALAGAALVVAVILNSPLFDIGGGWLFTVVFFIPAAAAIAILKYRLYDIDVVINKAVVVGVLAAFITIVYGGIVVGVGAAVGNAGSPVLSAVAAGVVAIAFQPVRHRAQRLANRFVYGERATPYEVLSDLSERVGASYATDDILPRMARILAEATGATRAEVWLREGRVLRRRGSWPAEVEGASVPLADDDLPAFDDRTLVMPVRHQGEFLGALTLEKPPNDPLTAAEEKLVADLASQAGLVLRNAALIEDLRSSRQRLVAAQDEERRRLERNLHDGAQQQLVAMAVKLRLLENVIPKDPRAALEMTRQVGSEVGDALDNLRDLARGIYPPLLADKGLPAALEAQARKAPVPVTVHADGIRRYGPQIEAAVYFVCLEALQNVAKYAEATKAVIHLSVDRGELRVEISDDGRGFDPSVTPMGTGLQGIIDRLAAIGGTVEVRSAPGAGATVAGRVPVAAGG
jgi:signal transduction histidine kinase